MTRRQILTMSITLVALFLLIVVAPTFLIGDAYRFCEGTIWNDAACYR